MHVCCLVETLESTNICCDLFSAVLCEHLISFPLLSLEYCSNTGLQGNKHGLHFWWVELFPYPRRWGGTSSAGIHARTECVQMRNMVTSCYEYYHKSALIINFCQQNFEQRGSKIYQGLIKSAWVASNYFYSQSMCYYTIPWRPLTSPFNKSHLTSPIGLGESVTKAIRSYSQSDMVMYYM